MVRWFWTAIAIAYLISGSPAQAATVYVIEAASNDETFVINGETFKAKIYCLGWEEGDRVVFLDGSAYGACVSATLFNLTRRERCEVWCE